MGDPKAESPPESALRLHWYDADIGKPEAQIWVHDDAGRPRFRIDVGDRAVKYGAEYFGEEFHPESQAAEDAARIEWLEAQRDWVIDVFTKADVYGLDLVAADRLRSGFRKALVQGRASGVTYIDLAR